MAAGIYLLLGTNIGNKKHNILEASRLIKERIGIVEKKSRVYETEAWGKREQPSFYNQVLKIKTFLPPEPLLKTIHTIEKELGRIREEKWEERIIDIDILYYNNLILDSSSLNIPHPEIQNRRFTLVPLCEIAEHLKHPVLKKSQQDLLRECPDELEVKTVPKKTLQ